MFHKLSFFDKLMNTFKNSYLNFAFADNKTEEFRLRFPVKFLILNGSPFLLPYLLPYSFFMFLTA